MKSQYWPGILIIALASCGPQRQSAEPTNNIGSPVLPEPSAPPAVANGPATAEAPTPTPQPGNVAEPTKAQPAKEASLPEPSGPIDPKSVEAAGQVVQHYGALIEQHRLAEAAKLWGDPAAANKFARQLPRQEIHLEIGQLGDTEGAAGSIYTTVPVVFYSNGFRKPAQVILRRVNDVPGSTEQQRHWHIERIDWGSGG